LPLSCLKGPQFASTIKARMHWFSSVKEKKV